MGSNLLRRGNGWQIKSLFLLALAAGALLSGCSLLTDDDKLPEGRCRVNGDCDEGFECVETYCQDIYHPRHEIKPF